MPRLSRKALDEKRQHILCAAGICFVRDGFHRATIADICRQAGVSTGAVYTYFPNKEAIIQAILEDARQRRSEQLGESGGDLNQALVLLEWADAVFTRQGQEAARVDVNLWAEAVRDPRVAKIARRALLDATKAVSAVADRRMKASRRLAGLDPGIAASLLVSIFLGLEVQTAVGVPLDGDKVVRVLTAFFADYLEDSAAPRRSATKKRGNRRVK